MSSWSTAIKIHQYFSNIVQELTKIVNHKLIISQYNTREITLLPQNILCFMTINYNSPVINKYLTFYIGHNYIYYIKK